jgi:RNA polymerase I-specific transcription initiation factor RRN7
VGVKCLAELLGYDFSYPIHNKRFYGTAGYPEFQLMSLVVIATKLSQPFDDVVRPPENDLDPSATKIDWIKWRDIMTEHADETLRRGDELSVVDSDVLNMSGKQMDEWMTWYHKTWIDDRDQKSMRPENTLLRSY